MLSYIVPHDASAHHAFPRPVEICREIRAMDAIWAMKIVNLLHH